MSFALVLLSGFEHATSWESSATNKNGDQWANEQLAHQNSFGNEYRYVISHLFIDERIGIQN